MKPIIVDHHLHDSLTNTWRKGKSQAQPMVSIVVKALRPKFNGNAIISSYPMNNSKILVDALADTGCQSCLSGQLILNKLNLKTSDLIPVRTKMRSANNGSINLLGAILLNISGSDIQGRTFSSNQMTYITDSTDTFFLSRNTCSNLGIISEDFPTIGEAFMDMEKFGTSALKHTADLETSIASCGCPTRQKPPPLPQPPVAITEDNRVQLEKFLLGYYASSTFNVCPHQPLPMMSGPPMKLMVDPNAIPVAHHKAIPVPIHFKDKVKEDLDRDVRLDVIEPVPTGTPTTWCHKMVVCAKQNGDPRRTIDFQALNKHACRETHHTSSPFHLARSVPPNTKKTTCDAWNGYHGVRLCKEDRHITTFITEWGRYRYKTAPQGYLASGDSYTSRYDSIISEVQNKIKCIDDTLLFAANIQESFIQTAKYLELCGNNGIILNPTKFTFAADEVEFAGFNITKTDVKPCSKYLRSIQDFPTPKNITDIRSWFGLVNQASYAFSKTRVMEPFRKLLKTGSKFEWSPDLDQAFQASKRTIVGEITEGVKIFEKSRVTCLATDWSKQGIGFWLLQKHCICPGMKPFCCNSGWKVTLVGSRFTHSAESRYAPVEGEALAVVNALEKAKHFVVGCRNLIIAVDHKPLLKLFGDRSLEDIPNSRLRNLKEKTLAYRFQMVHVSMIKNKVADGLSRHPSDPAEKIILPDDLATMIHQTECLSGPLSEATQVCDPVYTDVEEGTLSLLHSIFQASPITSTTWDLVRSATASDESLVELQRLIENGFPDAGTQLPKQLRPYFPLREYLSTVDGIIIYNDRLVIPPSLRPNVIATLHAAHQGVSSMISRAETSVFWPGITKDIQDVRERCHHCNRNAPSNPGIPPIPPLPPDYPFQCVCADFFTYKGISYLVIVDRYSNWPIIEKSQDSAAGLISTLRKVFTTFGVPEELSSDGGPQFVASNTRKFLKDYGVHHRLSSVAFPRSNGRAEVAVKTVKRLLMENTCPNGDLNNDSFQRAMLNYRNTPDRDTRLSPAMCVFGRHIRDFIPVLPFKYRPRNMWSNTLAAREAALRNRHARTQERLSQHTRHLPPLKIGDHVRIQNQVGPHPLKWDRTGIVVEVRQYDQYMVKVDGSNHTTLRNRRFLRHFTPLKPDIQTRSVLEDLRYKQLTKEQAETMPNQPSHTHQAEGPEHQTSQELPPILTTPHVSPEIPLGELDLQTEQPQNLKQKITACPIPDPTPTLTNGPTETLVRRSTRTSKPPVRLTYKELGSPKL